MSVYWHPELYYKDPVTGQFTVVAGEGLTVYYLSRRGGNPQWWIPFPKGFRMIAGDQSRRSFNGSDQTQTAISYACYGGDGFSGSEGGGGFPGYGSKTIGCSAIRLQIFFPSCWNGKDLDVPDHRSHMAYPIGDVSLGDCPATHPYRFPGIFFEAFYDTKYSLTVTVYTNGLLCLPRATSQDTECTVILSPAGTKRYYTLPFMTRLVIVGLSTAVKLFILIIKAEA